MTSETPYWEKPLATAGLISYRYKGLFSYIMIGARDHEDALRQAARSLAGMEPTMVGLEVWTGEAYEFVLKGEA